MQPEPETKSLLLLRCRAVWEGLAGVPVAFMPALQVAVSPDSRLSQRGWVGIVVLGDAAIATAPDAPTAQTFQRSIRDVACESRTRLSLQRSSRSSPRWRWWTSSSSRVASCAANPAEPVFVAVDAEFQLGPEPPYAPFGPSHRRAAVFLDEPESRHPRDRSPDLRRLPALPRSALE
jgi:hypothetical protein